MRSYLDVFRVRRARNVRINLLVGPAVELLELALQIGAAILVRFAARVVREAHVHINVLDLVLEQVRLVQKENHRGGLEPLRQER